MDNANTKEYLEKIRGQVVENLKRTAFAPSVQMTDVPRDPLVGGMDDEADAILDDMDEDENKDVRVTKRRFDQYVEKPGELSDSEDEEENAANGIRRQPGALKRKNHFNYKHLDADSGLESGLATPREESSIADEEVDAMGDAKMTEAPAAETEALRSPSAAEPPSRTEEASAPEQSEMAVDKQEEEPAAPAAAPTSVPVSRQPSLKAQDEDTTMEDAQPPAPEPEQPESAVPSEKPEEEEKKPAGEGAPSVDKPAAVPSSPSKAQSPAKEVSEPVGEDAKQPEAAETAEKTETTAPAEATEAAAAAPTEAAEPEKAPEAPKDESTAEKAGEEPKTTGEANIAKTAEESKEPSSEQESEEPAKKEE